MWKTYTERWCHLLVTPVPAGTWRGRFREEVGYGHARPLAVCWRRIQWYREQRGISRPVLAGLVGRNARWIKAVESGQIQTPRLPMLLRIAYAPELSDLTGNGEAVPVRVFTGEQRGALRRPNFNQRVKWTATLTAIGLKGVHFHDLRHSRNTWAAQAGTSTKDLMVRMGHDDMRAAIIYQHASIEADQAIADKLSALVSEPQLANSNQRR